ncbi:MAG TPA: proton-conducting transporter membrane subunit, partial [Elusimicrobiales bacterium]|nr:proton-conducting transporter membrane subunit [Elusimicrobiales bacterium]
MMIGPDLLNIAIYLPLAAGALIALLPRAKEHLSGPLALAASLLAFLPALALYLGFDPALPGMQFAQDLPWLSALGARYAVGLDGVSLLMFILTAFLTPIAVLSSFDAVKEHRRFYYASLLALETGMLGVFAALDLLLFYVFWEAMLIPMYFIIGIWGGQRRIYASVKFFIYTMAGSLLMLAAILWLYFDHQSRTGVY